MIYLLLYMIASGFELNSYIGLIQFNLFVKRELCIPGNLYAENACQ